MRGHIFEDLLSSVLYKFLPKQLAVVLGLFYGDLRTPLRSQKMIEMSTCSIGSQY